MIMSYTNRSNLTFSFPIWMLLFLFLTCLLWLGLPILFNRSGESGYPCLVPDIRGKASNISYEEYNVSCGVATYIVFIIMEICFCYTQFIGSSYYQRTLNFLKSFFCLNWDEHMIFIIPCVNVMHDLTWALNHPCIPGINPIWS